MQISMVNVFTSRGLEYSSGKLVILDLNQFLNTIKKVNFILFQLLFIIFFSTSTFANEERGIIFQSHKTFKKLTRFKIGRSIHIINYRHYRNRTLEIFRFLHEAENEIKGIPIQQMCGSYDNTNKVAIIENLAGEFICDASGGWVCPFEVVAQCKDGKVMHYLSPIRIRLVD